MGTRLALADAWVAAAAACVTCAPGTGHAPSASSTTSPLVGCATSATPPEVGTSVGGVVGCGGGGTVVGIGSSVVVAVGGVASTGVARVTQCECACVCGVAVHPHTALHYCVAGSGGCPGVVSVGRVTVE